ncbi:hypothetical protein H0H81_004313 [Sphagnurus paluster]|uniref:Uncharacterized protein n=1 Tax=Sphagnurus paluster TaxID=117069 RepID=A0A9P7K2G9_9AGAR|nr:hypothetical protein H0H81_004313 [Sphagnurus paluster]
MHCSENTPPQPIIAPAPLPPTMPPQDWQETDMPALMDVSDAEDTNEEEIDNEEDEYPPNTWCTPPIHSQAPTPAPHPDPSINSTPSFPSPHHAHPPPFDFSLYDDLYFFDNDNQFVFEENKDDENHAPFYSFHDPEGCGDPEDDGDAQQPTFTMWPGVFVFPPTHQEAEDAFANLSKILKPP